MEVWGGNRAESNAVSTPGIDAFVYAAPYQGNHSGGDVHYVSMCAAGRIARFVVADVSGHGEKVGQAAARLRDLMRANINTPDQSRLTRVLSDEFQRGDDSGLFATAILATYFTPTDHLILCNAGHPRPFLYRAASTSWRVLHADDPDHRVLAARDSTGLKDLPLGVVEPTNYTQFAIRLEPGDLVLLYTDSFIETRGIDGKLLGEPGLLRLAHIADGTRPTGYVERLIELIRAHAGGAAFDDDVTAVLLHHNATDPPRYTIGERARTLARMLGLGRV